MHVMVKICDNMDGWLPIMLLTLRYVLTGLMVTMVTPFKNYCYMVVRC